jgi:predicted regulator of Ras-like GTPase activity (Roadblock/LC7/MglB family)
LIEANELKTKPVAVEETEQATEAPVIVVGEEKTKFEALSASLAEIRKLKGVLGYILRSDTSAIIDLNDQDKIIPYAILSSQICESSLEMGKQFNLGATESVLVEGNTVKVLCMSLGENRVSVFMEKSATHAWIIKRIAL